MTPKSIAKALLMPLVMLFSSSTKKTGPGINDNIRPIENAWKTISM
jgi:hypothetical protein